VNDNLDFYIFNSFYMIFNTIDSDSDGDINWDTNDYIIMSNNFSTTDRVQSVVSNAGANMDLVPFLGMAYTIDYIKQTAFTNSEQLSYNSINLVNSAMLSSNTKAVVAMISNTFTAMITNLNSFFDFFNTNNLTNLFKVGDYNLLTNLFTNNYAVFTNKLYGQGIWPPSRISNAMPDMVNVYPVLTNYYQHISLDW
jgi:hypothetical protein